MEYRTIEGVELLTVGMEWHSVSGDQTFTFEHLADAMEAANEDPHIVSPRIKIGHQDPRFNPEGTWHNPFDEPDGAPALGSVKNLRLENDGAVLIGDFVEVPVWLAEAIPSAYPNRSIEGAYIDGSWEVETQGGKRYSFVLTGCALLGIFGPAVADLEDLERLLIEGPKEDEVTTLTQGDIAKAAVAAAAGGVTLAADIDKVRGEFWRDFATEEHNRYWWWPRSIWTDPNEIIADDDEGHLYRVAFSSDDEGNVTFEEPQEVRETFVDVTNNQPVAARQGEPSAVYASRKDAGREKPKPAASRPQSEEERVDTDKAIRESLGLAEDATDDEVIAKAKELNEAETEETNETEKTTAEETVTPSDEIPEEEPVAASTELSEGMVAVPADQWAKVQEGAQAGAKLASDTESQRRDDTIKAAMKVGKIRPADRDSMVNLHEANPKGFYTLLTAEVKDGGLAKGLIPVDERGVAGGGDEVTASAGLPGAWFPELNANGAASAKEGE